MNVFESKRLSTFSQFHLAFKRIVNSIFIPILIGEGIKVELYVSIIKQNSIKKQAFDCIVSGTFK